jgi:transposase InsO family protein
LKVLCTDRRGEFTLVEFMQHCAEHDVHHQLTTPYSPQQNGVVERQNQSIVTMARCLLKTKKFPSYFWGEAVTMAIYILNRPPTHDVDGKTPYEARHGETLTVHLFCCQDHKAGFEKT